MPWQHCNQELLDSLESCPECGVTKEQWTVEVDLTRTFQVAGGRPLVKIRLTNQAGDPVPSETYEVQFEESQEEADADTDSAPTPTEGELDENGYAKVVAPRAGTCTVTFPYRLEGDIVLQVEEEETGEAGEESDAGEQAEDSEDAGGEDEAEAEEDEEAALACFECETRSRTYDFRLGPTGFIDYQLMDYAGREPLRNISYYVTDFGAVFFQGTTDDEGRLDHGEVSRRAYTLSIGDVFVFVPAVVEDDRGMRIRVHGVALEPEPEEVEEEPREEEGIEDEDAGDVAGRLSLLLKSPSGEALSQARYALTLGDADPIEGTTNDEGLLEEDIPEGVPTGHLRVWQGEFLALEVDLQIGEPDPIEEVTGGQARLAALGFFPGALDGEVGPKMQNALKCFQKVHQLEVTGEYSAEVQTKLRELSTEGA